MYVCGCVQVHWSWDVSGDGGNCTKENGNVTIVPGSGGAKGQQVASCDGRGGDHGGHRYPVALYCQVADALSLQAHYTWIEGDDDGPVMHRGCSPVTIDGKPYPDAGQCCFV